MVFRFLRMEVIQPSLHPPTCAANSNHKLVGVNVADSVAVDSRKVSRLANICHGQLDRSSVNYCFQASSVLNATVVLLCESLLPSLHLPSGRSVILSRSLPPPWQLSNDDQSN